MRGAGPRRSERGSLEYAADAVKDWRRALLPGLGRGRDGSGGVAWPARELA